MVGFSKIFVGGCAVLSAVTEADVCPFGHHKNNQGVFEDGIEASSRYNSQKAQQKFDYLRAKIDSTPESAPWLVHKLYFNVEIENIYDRVHIY